jgi:8-oxo-dGTP diphosphatase
MPDEGQNRTVKTTVAAIITRDDSSDPSVLLTRRGVSPFQDQWCLPGGHIEQYERADHAIRREVKEEVGIDFIPKFFSYFDEIIPEKDIHAVVLVFDGTFSGFPQIQSNEVREIKWFSFTEANQEELAFKHNQLLVAYQATRSLR